MLPPKVIIFSLFFSLQTIKNQNEREFFARLQSLEYGVHFYENPDLQRQALDVLPVSELKQRAKGACEKSKENGQDGVDERDCLFLEVVRWFGMNVDILNLFYCINLDCVVSENIHTPPTEGIGNSWDPNI